MKFVLAGLVALFVLGADMSFSGPSPSGVALSIVTTADGQPARRSVRRTARRTSRRTAERYSGYYGAPRIYPALPGGCVTVVVNGVRVHRCGGIYYRPSAGGYVVFHP